MPTQPLKVSYCIFCYNQRDFVADALNSAFQQDYPNLEIIFSDDCSPDDSYELAVRIASEYQGPHQVIVRRNDRNLGVVGHVNEVGRIASGEYLVFTAGDDVSSSSRARITIDAITRSPSRASACFCEEVQFSTHIPWDKLICPAGAINPRLTIFPPEFVFSRLGGLADGALWTYSRDCFHAFPEIPSTFTAEDHILPLRAALYGNIVEVAAPLVGRRLVEESLGRKLNREKPTDLERISRDLKNHLDCVNADIAAAIRQGVVSERQSQKLAKLVAKRVRKDSYRYPLLTQAQCKLPAKSHCYNIVALLLRGEYRFAARYGRKWTTSRPHSK